MSRHPFTRIGTRFAAGAAASALAVGLAGCGSSAALVVVSAAAGRTLDYAPGGSAPVVAAIDEAVVVERRSTVIEVEATEGEPVRAGQVLLRVYTIGQSAAVSEATNRLRADEKQLPFVQSKFGKLADESLALLDKITKERANLTRLKNAPTVLTAPVDGRVSGLNVTPGATLDRSDAVLHVIDDTAERVVVPIVVNYRDQLKTGQSARVTLPSLPGRTFDATISSIGAVVPARIDGKTISAEETVPVTVKFANRDGAVVTGSTAYASFPMTKSAAVAVNSLAVLGQDRPYVLVVAEHTVRQRQVVVGVTDGNFTEIVSGLSAGDDVVISGGAKLVDGSSVRVTHSDDS